MTFFFFCIVGCVYRNLPRVHIVHTINGTNSFAIEWIECHKCIALTIWTFWKLTIFLPIPFGVVKWERKRKKREKILLFNILMSMTYDECQCNCASWTSEMAKEFCHIHLKTLKHTDREKERQSRSAHTSAFPFFFFFFHSEIYFSSSFCEYPWARTHTNGWHEQAKSERTNEREQWVDNERVWRRDNERERAHQKKHQPNRRRLHDEAHAHIHRCMGQPVYMFYGCFCGSLIAAVAAYITTLPRCYVSFVHTNPRCIIKLIIKMAEDTSFNSLSFWFRV